MKCMHEGTGGEPENCTICLRARLAEAERELAQAFSRDAFDQFNRERERAEKAEQERDEIAKELDARSAGRVVVAGYICNDRELKIQTGKQAEWTSISMLLCKQRPASGPCISNGGNCRKIVVTEGPINAS